jgi:hypothetical protein
MADENLVNSQNVYGGLGAEIVSHGTLYGGAGYKTRTFPQNLKENGQKTYIRFQVIDEEPVTVSGLGSNFKTALVDLAQTFANAEDNSTNLFGQGQFASQVIENLGNVQNTRLERDTTLKLKDGMFADLYMPANISFQGGASYNTGVQIGAVGAMGLKALTSGAGVSGAIGDMLGTAGKTLAQGLKGSGKSPAVNLAVNAVLQKAENVPGGATLKNVAGLASQVTVNPNSRVLFKGVGHRSFDFTFTMIPTSPQEARAISDIVLFFRTQLYPESIDEAGVSMGYKFPERFYIYMMYDGKPIFHRIKPSYLKDVNVTYNETKQSFIKYQVDGGEAAYDPVETTMTLSFVESTTLVRQDIELDEKGYGY